MSTDLSMENRRLTSTVINSVDVIIASEVPYTIHMFGVLI